MRNTFGALVALFAVIGPATAAPMIVDWPTFLRSGPGPRYTVLQELQRATEVEALSCDAQWCEVRLAGVLGYVARANLAAPDTLKTLPAQPKSGTTCFAANNAGYANGEEYRFCPR